MVCYCFKHEHRHTSLGKKNNNQGIVLDQGHSVKIKVGQQHQGYHRIVRLPFCYLRVYINHLTLAYTM